MTLISVANLDISFGSGADRVDAVKDVSFEVGSKESFGLVGESGSGKSTILRALAGLNPNWQGTITYDGEALASRQKLAFHKKVQMVFQDPFGSLHPRQTVDQTLREPLAIHRMDERERRILEALDQVRLGPEFRFRFPHQLSGGQRQRVAVARALILEPETLLLDEPTSALDVSIQAEILNLLVELRQSLALTFVLVSHNLGVIGHMCDRLAVMQQGRILEFADGAVLEDGAFETGYAQQLYRASQGYSREALETA
ncbi:MAG: ABC transporter ATP-binding protein [Alphaproteobacteria bacterium]